MILCSCGAAQGPRHSRGVGLVSGMHLGRDPRTDFEIHRKLQFVGEMRAAIFQFGGPSIRVGWAPEVLGGRLSASAIAVQPDQALRHRRADAAVSPRNRAPRRVGFHRRGIDASPLAPDQAVLPQMLEHPGEHVAVHFERRAAPGAAELGLVRHVLAELQELARWQAVGTAPFQAALAMGALEIAEKKHAEIASPRKLTPRCTLRQALRLSEPIEARHDQRRLLFVVGSMPWTDVASPSMMPPCLLAARAALNGPSATSLPRRNHTESNQDRFCQRSV